MSHFVRSRNLPFSVEDIKKITSPAGTVLKLSHDTLNPTAPASYKSYGSF